MRLVERHWLLRGAPWLLTAVYLTMAAAWIYFSDRALLSVSEDVDLLTRLQSVKGLGFVGATALLLWWMVAGIQAIDRSLIHKLERSESTWRGLFDAHPVAALLCAERDGRILAVNPAAQQLLGLDAPSLIGHPTPWADNDCSVPHAGLRQHQCADGRLIEIELHCSSLPFGEVDAVLIVAIDMTEHNRSVRERAATAAALERNSSAMAELAFAASHDLREPVRKIVAFGERLAEVDPLKDAQRFVDMRERIVGAAMRMQTLIDDLLAYSRAGQRQLEAVSTPLREVVDLALIDIAAAVEESNAQILVHPLPQVVCDAAQLRRVFQNLLVNAITFRREDHPLSIEICANEVAAEVPVGQARWRIEIRDNGIGVPAEAAERIFAPFQRLHGRDRYPGSGMGLAIARRIVEQHGGRIGVEPGLDAGSVFYFELPACAEQPNG